MRYIILILAMISVFPVFGQKKMMKKSKTAFKYYEKGKKYQALLIFKELVKDYPNSQYYGRNLYNIPTIYQEIDSIESAIIWFQKVINDKKLNDFEKDYSRGIFETNTNFKHYASLNIGVINYNKNNYIEALKYYKLANTKYPYYNTSGTDIKLNKLKLASNISDCYKYINQIDSAIVTLLPHVLTESPQFNNSAEMKLIELIKEHKLRNSFKSELEKSIDNIEKIQHGILMICYGIRVKIYPYSEEELTKEYFKNTNFYLKLNKKSW